ncbi:MAG: dTDP-4-dehydrorhamnose 3,5-epimerase [Myxococcota bacterium]
MRIIPTDIGGLVWLESPVYTDDRGSFMVGWRQEDLAGLVGWSPFVQESLSTSRRGVLRGLHLQHPHAQGKLVRVIAGAIFDVAVDLRPDSPTFRQHVSGPLQADGRALWLPPGFAHGFLVTSPQAVVLYQVTDDWVPAAEHTICWDDPALGIDWPLSGPPILSQRDASAPTLDRLFTGQ